MKSIVIYTDGGSRGNPGPGAGAYVLLDGAGMVIGGKGFFLGNTTNNFAEYTGLCAGLAAAAEMGAEKVTVFSDSQLMVRQINGQYRVKSANLKGLYRKCVEILGGFSKWEITHVMRESNKEADALANKSMDKKCDVVLEGTGKVVKASFGGGKRLRLGVLLSGGGTTMVNIQKEIEAGNLNAEIAVVISSLSTVRGVELAKNMGLKLEVIRKKDHGDIDSFSGAIEKALNDSQVDLVVQAGWLCLWNIPAGYENRVMNIHPALLPSFGGQGMWGHHVHEAVVKKGCKVSGCTVHFCTNEYDMGPIIVQRGCSINDRDDADAVAAKVFEQECIAYPEAIQLFAEGRLVCSGGVVKVKPAVSH